MYKIIVILVLLLSLYSCKQEKEKALEGFWRLDFQEQQQTSFFPHALSFRVDTLPQISVNMTIIDGNLYKHQVHFTIQKDTLSLNFSNGSVTRVAYQIKSDSVLFFDDKKFVRIRSEHFPRIQHYDLIDLDAKKLLKYNANTATLHLIKRDGKLQVLLNGRITDLKYIPQFLGYNSNETLKVALYIGKGVNLKDLIQADQWIHYAGVNQVALVTKHQAYKEFYYSRHYIDISDSLINQFVKQNKLPPRNLKSDRVINQNSLQ